MEHLRRHTLFAGKLVSIRDVCCTAGVSGCGAEEWSATRDVVFTRRGMYLKQVGRERVVADANQVLFYGPELPYRVEHPVAGGDETTVLTFTGAVLREALREYVPAVGEMPEPVFGVTHGPVAPETLWRQQLLRHRVRAGIVEPLAVEEEALALLRQVVQAAYSVRGQKPIANRPATAQARRAQVEGAKTFLARRLGEALTLEEVSRAVHCSPFHLARLFRQKAGVPLHQYLHRLRLAAALDRVADGEQDLTRLALALGFSSHSHFSAAFRRLFGLPPSALRQMSKNLTADLLSTG